MDKAVLVNTAGGTPYMGLTLDVGGTVDAVYVSGSGTSSLTFRYVVEPGDLDGTGVTVGTSIVLDGASIDDEYNNPAILTLEGAASTSGVLVDAVPPVVTSITLVGPATNSSASDAFTVTFSEAVTGVTASDFTLTRTGTVTGTVTSLTAVSDSVYTVTVDGITGGGTMRLDLNSSGTGIADLATNPIETGFTTGQSYTIELPAPPAPSTPVVTAVGVPASGTYTTGQDLDFLVTFSQPVIVTGAPRVALVPASGGTLYADYLSGSGTAALVFRFTVRPGDMDLSPLTLAPTIGLDGGSIEGSSTVDAALALGSVPSLAGVVVDGALPALAMVAPSSGPTAGGTTVTVTGTGLVPGATSIVFGNRPAAMVTCTSSTECTAVSPAGPLAGATVDVSVSVAGIASPRSRGDRFTYRACGTGDRGFVCQAYFDLLHRSVDARGLATWSAALSSGKSSRAEVAADIMASAEYRADLVGAWYESFLGRAPSAEETARWLSVLRSGRLGEAVMADIVGSGEFYERAGGTTAGFISDAYQDLLGRAPGPAGLGPWSAALRAGMSRTELARRVMASAEYRMKEVGAWYTTYLRRAATPAEIAGWAQRLEEGATSARCAADIIGSPEYLARLGD
jgi:hypothetical protein